MPASTWVIWRRELETSVHSDECVFTVQHLGYGRLVIPDCNDTSFHSLTAVKQTAASYFPGSVDVIHGQTSAGAQMHVRRFARSEIIVFLSPPALPVEAVGKLVLSGEEVCCRG